MSDKEIAVAASNAASDLHMAAAIQQLCEASLFRTTRGRRFAAKLARFAREHQALQYRAHERALNRLTGGSDA